MEKANIDWSNIGFGYIPTDKRYVTNFKDGAWDEGCLTEDDKVVISECAGVLQYAQTCFEGLKAYKCEDGSINLFRPACNFERMNNSNDRLVIPELDVDFCVHATKTLVDIDKDWIPSGNGESLYIRPFVIATDPFLGVRASDTYKFFILLSPSGAYYAHGIKPVKIYVEDTYVRAVRGGTGFTKCAGNYACSLIAQTIAHDKGYEQVLWLDGVEQKYIEEVGAMNVMFKIDGTVVTPKLIGSILPGITRKSCIELLQDKGIPVEERRISAEELFEALRAGKLEEAWGTGTAAVVSPIGELAYGDEKYTVNNFEIGETTQWLYDTLTGMQWGKIADDKGWIIPID